MKLERRFVVGYEDGQTIWGRDGFEGIVAPDEFRRGDYCSAMTYREAQQGVREMATQPAVIFELVPVKKANQRKPKE